MHLALYLEKCHNTDINGNTGSHVICFVALFRPDALRVAKTWSFGHSECKRAKKKATKQMA